MRLISLFLLYSGIAAAQWTVGGGFQGIAGNGVGYGGFTKFTYYLGDPAVGAYLLADADKNGQKGIRTGLQIAVAETSNCYVRLFVEPGVAFQNRATSFAIGFGVSPQFFIPDLRSRFAVEPFARVKYTFGTTTGEFGVGFHYFLR
jgi:hypothetical protein